MSGPRGWSVAVPIGGRLGRAGLGNQAIAMGKAWLGASVLGQRYVDVPWGLNPRGYRSEFRSSRLDWAKTFALRGASRVVLDERAFRDWGGVDYGRFVADTFDGEPVPLIVCHDSNMEGGFASIVGARSFLASRLTGTHAVQSSKLLSKVELERLDVPIITLHFRAGDFEADPPGPGEFNRRLPASWYRDMIVSLEASAAVRPKYYIVCEPDPTVVRMAKNLGEGLAPGRISVVSNSPTVDLALLARSDLIVCSVSSFSMLAAFISDSPYIWYGGQLSRTAGRRGIWPDEMRPRFHDTRGHAATEGRGVPASSVSDFSDLSSAMERNLELRAAGADLMLYGSLPTTKDNDDANRDSRAS